MDYSKRDKKERGVKSIKAEALDYNTTKGSDSTRGYIIEKEGQNKHPALDVEDTLLKLRPLPHVVLNTSPVASHTFDRHGSIGFRQPTSGHRRVRQIVEHEGTIKNGDGAENKEEPSPVWNSIVVDVSNAIAKESTTNLTYRVAQIPE